MTVPHGSSQDAVLDQWDTLLGDTLEIEGLRQTARVERVVCDRDLLVEVPLAEFPAEITAFLEQGQAAERVEGEVLQELADRIRPEHGPVRAWGQLVRVDRPPRDFGGFARNRRRITVANGPGGLLGVSGRSVRGGER